MRPPPWATRSLPAPSGAGGIRRSLAGARPCAVTVSAGGRCGRRSADGGCIRRVGAHGSGQSGAAAGDRSGAVVHVLVSLETVVARGRTRQLEGQPAVGCEIRQTRRQRRSQRVRSVEDAGPRCSPGDGAGGGKSAGGAARRGGGPGSPSDWNSSRIPGRTSRKKPQVADRVIEAVDQRIESKNDGVHLR